MSQAGRDVTLGLQERANSPQIFFCLRLVFFWGGATELKEANKLTEMLSKRLFAWCKDRKNKKNPPFYVCRGRSVRKEGNFLL